MTEVGIIYNLQEFNSSLLKENIYRQDASPEVDAAWDALGVNCTVLLSLGHLNDGILTLFPDRGVRVSPGEAEESGLVPGHVQISDKYGGGFPAHLEGLHHLNCLVFSLSCE